MAKKEKVYKCWYKNCKNKKVSENDTTMIKVGNKRFHKTCYQNQENLKKCRELYIQYINPAVIHSQLNKALNTLILDKKVEVDFLLYVIEYVIDNKIEVKAPYTLYYKVNDYKIKNAYNNLDNVKSAVNGLKIFS